MPEVRQAHEATETYFAEFAKFERETLRQPEWLR